eukprot:2379415-Pleurochrysis_carterae.AAC.1
MRAHARLAKLLWRELACKVLVNLAETFKFGTCLDMANYDGRMSPARIRLPPVPQTGIRPCAIDG